MYYIDICQDTGATEVPLSDIPVGGRFRINGYPAPDVWEQTDYISADTPAGHRRPIRLAGGSAFVNEAQMVVPLTKVPVANS